MLYEVITAPPVDCSGSCEAILVNIEQEVAKTLEFGKIPVVLGGEHTVTCGVIAALKKQYDNFGVIQFDAHADLRDSYEGSKFVITSYSIHYTKLYDGYRYRHHI